MNYFVNGKGFINTSEPVYFFANCTVLYPHRAFLTVSVQLSISATVTCRLGRLGGGNIMDWRQHLSQRTKGREAHRAHWMISLV